MVVPTPAADGVLLQQTPTGGSLAGVKNLARQTSDLLDVAVRQRGDSAEPLEEVQGGPLACQDGSHRARHDSQAIARFDPGAIGPLCLESKRVIDEAKG